MNREKDSRFVNEKSPTVLKKESSELQFIFSPKGLKSKLAYSSIMEGGS